MNNSTKETPQKKANKKFYGKRENRDRLYSVRWLRDLEAKAKIFMRENEARTNMYVERYNLLQREHPEGVENKDESEVLAFARYRTEDESRDYFIHSKYTVLSQRQEQIELLEQKFCHFFCLEDTKKLLSWLFVLINEHCLVARMHINRRTLLQGIKKICEDFEFDTSFDFSHEVKKGVFEMFKMNRTLINNMAAVVLSLGFELNHDIFIKNVTRSNAIFPRLETTRSNRTVSTHPETSEIESEGSLENEHDEIESDGSLEAEPLESIPLIESHAESEPTRVEPGPAEPILLYSPETAESIPLIKSHAESEPTRVEPGPAEPILLYSPETAKSTHSITKKRKRRVMSEPQRKSERLAKKAKADDSIERVAIEPIEPIESITPIEPIEAIECVATEPIEPIEPIEAIEHVATDPIEPIEPIEAIEHVATDPIEPIEPIEAIEHVVTDPIEPIVSVEPVPEFVPEPIEPIEPVKSAQC